MKTTISLTACLLLLIFLFVRGITPEEKINNEAEYYSKKAKAVIDAKCYGCHSPKGKSDDAKEALLWDDLPGLTKAKQVAVLDEIIEVLEEGTMPPEKFLEKKPEAKLTDKEVKTLLAWAEKTADGLMK